MKHCANRKCRDWMEDDSHSFCMSCRFIARWAFALGAFVVGATAAIFKLIS